MNSRNAKLKGKSARSNAIRMASVLSTMSFREESNGWTISFARRGRKVGSWFNPDIITGNSFAYGRREKKPGRKVEEVYSLSN
jgi:hypothetical protein